MWMLLGVFGVLAAAGLTDVISPRDADEDEGASGASGDGARDDDDLLAVEKGTQKGGQADLLTMDQPQDHSASADAVTSEHAPQQTASLDDLNGDLQGSEVGAPGVGTIGVPAETTEGSMPPTEAFPAGNDLAASAPPDTEFGGAGNGEQLGSAIHDSSWGNAPSDWEEGEYISSDLPREGPPNDYVDAGDQGGNHEGGAGDDTLQGGALDDWLQGNSGNDLILGNDGGDTLVGDRGDDTLIGGEGSDSLIAGEGADVLDGGAGNDSLLGGADAETLLGGAGDDQIRAGFGDDVLVSGAGSDTLLAGGGNDTLYGVDLASPEPSEDAGTSNAPLDAYVDFLNGGDGDDLIVLGAGDIATGGAGGDSFVLGDWISADDPAEIQDFTPSEDRLVITYPTDGPLPDVGTAYDETLAAMLVYIDGNLVATLPGTESLAPEQIELVRENDIPPPELSP